MPARKIAALALSLVLAGSLAACGGDDEGGDGGDEAGGGETVSATEFAGSVCGAMKTWVTTVQEKSTEMATGATGSPEESKDLLVTLLGDMSAATGDLVAAVEGAGVPDVEGGEAVAQDLADAFREAEQILEDAQSDVEALPDDPAGFQQGAAELGPTLQEAISSITDSLEEPESDELEKAFDEEEACQSAAA